MALDYTQGRNLVADCLPGVRPENGGTMNESRYADLLNQLHEMQGSMAYAVRWPVLRRAEILIADLESTVNQLTDLARAVRCTETCGPFCDDIRGVNWFDFRGDILGENP